MPITIGGSAGIEFYSHRRQLSYGLSPIDHNDDDGVSIVHLYAGAGNDYYINISSYNLFNGNISARYYGAYHVEVTDITGVSAVVNNLAITTTSENAVRRKIGPNSWAQYFETGGHAGGYTIDRIQLFIEGVDAVERPEVSIW